MNWASLFPGLSAGLRNVLRWIALLLVGALSGVAVVVLDPNSHHATWDFIRNIFIVEVPTLAALKSTLEQSLGIGVQKQSEERTRMEGGTKIVAKTETEIPIKVPIIEPANPETEKKE